MSKYIRLAILIVSVLPVLCLQGCSTGNFYLKTVAAKDATISSDMKIAVIPENWYWLGVSNFLPRALVTEFMDLGFTVVERSQLEEVFKELRFGASGATQEENAQKQDKGMSFAVLDKTSIKKVGEMLGVNALLISYIVPGNNENVVSQATFRLVDVETAQVLFSVTFINASTDGSKLIKAGGAVPTRQVIKAISVSIGKLLKGEKRLEGKMGTLDVTVNPIKK